MDFPRFICGLSRFTLYLPSDLLHLLVLKSIFLARCPKIVLLLFKYAALVLIPSTKITWEQMKFHFFIYFALPECRIKRLLFYCSITSLMQLINVTLWQYNCDARPSTQSHTHIVRAVFLIVTVWLSCQNVETF